VIVALKVNVLGQAPVKVDGLVLAVTPVTANVLGVEVIGAELTVVTTDLVTVPAVLVALIVYTVDVAGDITMTPTALTWPIPLSILTELAPVTFHNKVAVPPGLIVAGLLLKVPITAGVPDGGVAGNAGI
jgi:hypothetical protein